MAASESGEVVKFDEADMPQLDVWLEDETVWLTQAQMAELFGCAIANINMHLNHIYADEELEEAATIKDFLIVRFEGRRRVARSVKHDNLDAIISVGFRVNTKRGIKFRQWATKVLKEYLLRGLVRDLDFGRFGSLQYVTTDANPSGTNGWFAVNKGRLKLPRSLPNRSGYKCVGDCYTAKVDLGGTSRRLANTFNYEFTGAELNHFVFSELYATDRDDIPAGLGGRSADKVLAVWRIGYFSDGPEIDEPTHPVSFTSAKLKFKFSPEGVDGLHGVYVYRHDGTANGKWMRTGARAEPNKAMPIAATGNFEPSSENWNLGWFAIVGRTAPFGTFVNIR